jgi:hypothetical protein
MSHQTRHSRGTHACLWIPHSYSQGKRCTYNMWLRRLVVGQQSPLQQTYATTCWIRLSRQGLHASAGMIFCTDREGITQRVLHRPRRDNKAVQHSLSYMSGMTKRIKIVCYCDKLICLCRHMQVQVGSRLLVRAMYTCQLPSVRHASHAPLKAAQTAGKLQTHGS